MIRLLVSKKRKERIINKYLKSKVREGHGHKIFNR